MSIGNQTMFLTKTRMMQTRWVPTASWLIRLSHEVGSTCPWTVSRSCPATASQIWWLMSSRATLKSPVGSPYTSLRDVSVQPQLQSVIQADNQFSDRTQSNLSNQGSIIKARLRTVESTKEKCCWPQWPQYLRPICWAAALKAMHEAAILSV